MFQKRFSFGIKRITAVVLLSALLLSLLSACGIVSVQSEKKICPKAVILPMLEVGELTGDMPGEAQFYYEEYFSDPSVYDVTNEPCGGKFYFQNGIGMYLLGQGKATSAVNVTALLCDDRFDFTDTLFLVSGCAGSSKGFGVVGDVYMITSVVDYELGNSADVRDLEDASDPLWYRMPDYDSIAYRLLNPKLIKFAFDLTANIELKTTDDARSCMARNFENAAWAVRDPAVLKGTSVTADSYWKGDQKHELANYITEQYQAPDPYAATEMEDTAIALAFEKLGLLDQLLILRCSVNMDVFLDGDTPESLWAEGKKLFDNGFDGFSDIFPVAMENCFRVGKIIIEEVRQKGIPEM